MNKQERRQRIAAIKTTDAINAIKGVPVSELARELYHRWAIGEITREALTVVLLEPHKRLAAKQPET